LHDLDNLQKLGNTDGLTWWSLFAPKGDCSVIHEQPSLFLYLLKLHNLEKKDEMVIKQRTV